MARIASTLSTVINRQIDWIPFIKFLSKLGRVMTPEFRPHYITYFDVLGYKAYFEGGGDVERLFDSIMDLT